MGADLSPDAAPGGAAASASPISAHLAGLATALRALTAVSSGFDSRLSLRLLPALCLEPVDGYQLGRLVAPDPADAHQFLGPITDLSIKAEAEKMVMKATPGHALSVAKAWYIAANIYTKSLRDEALSVCRNAATAPEDRLRILLEYKGRFLHIYSPIAAQAQAAVDEALDWQMVETAEAWFLLGCIKPDLRDEAKEAFGRAVPGKKAETAAAWEELSCIDPDDGRNEALVAFRRAPNLYMAKALKKLSPVLRSYHDDATVRTKAIAAVTAVEDNEKEEVAEALALSCGQDEKTRSDIYDESIDMIISSASGERTSSVMSWAIILYATATLDEAPAKAIRDEAAKAIVAAPRNNKSQAAYDVLRRQGLRPGS